jgi:protein-S-isoprenylcysteine O-methyltransferase Ste14
MLEQIHKHLVSEIQQNTRTDTIFIITAILLNLLSLGINSAMASNSREDTSLFLVMFIIVALVIVVNIIVIIGLIKGKQTRVKLTNGLIKMYKDQNVDKYYDSSLLLNYNTRYNLFILAVVFIGAIAIAIPFIIR